MKTKFKSISLFVMLFVLSICTVSLATVIENPSAESGETVYIDSYEDYEQLVEDTNTEYNQEELKRVYAEYTKYMREYYNQYERDETVKAKVIEAGDIVEQYDFDQYYYSASKYELQPIGIEIVEGEYAGKRFNIDYLLTGDALNNLKYSKLKVGDTVFVSVYQDESTGEYVAEFTNAGSNIERFGTVFCIGIIAMVLLILYGGKKGILTTLITLLILDFCLIIIPNMGFAGQGFVIGGIALILLMIFTVSISKLGLNKKAVKASVIAIIINIITIMLLVIFNYLTRIAGVTYEVAALSENVLLGNMNFESLYIIITMIIASLAITNVICKCIEKLEKSEAVTFNEKLSVCKNSLGGNVLLVVVSLMALYIPNHLLLLTNKYTSTEILNAEILATELIRLFTIIIAMALTVPTVVAFDEKKIKKE